MKLGVAVTDPIFNQIKEPICKSLHFTNMRPLCAGEKWQRRSVEIYLISEPYYKYIIYFQVYSVICIIYV